MAIDLRNGVAIILLLAAAIVTWYWSRPAEPPRVVRRAEDQAPLGYYVRGARMQGTDANGRVTYRILADRLEELPDQSLLELNGVRIEYSPADEVPWLIRAERASTPKSGARLDLEGDVELRSEPTDGKKPIAITTARLTFVPDESMAVSSEPVRLTVGDWHVDAVGLNANLKDDEVELESNVHGQVAP